MQIVADWRACFLDALHASDDCAAHQCSACCPTADLLQGPSIWLCMSDRQQLQQRASPECESVHAVPVVYGSFQAELTALATSLLSDNMVLANGLCSTICIWVATCQPGKTGFVPDIPDTFA